MRWTIRNKVIVCLGMLMTIIGTLAFSGFQGVYSYRRLARSISKRAEELPFSENLRNHTDNLQAVLESYKTNPKERQQKTIDQIFEHMALLSKSIDAYEKELDNAEDSDLTINDTQRELELVEEIRAELANVHKMLEVPDALGSKASSNAIQGSMTLLTQKLSLIHI